MREITLSDGKAYTVRPLTRKQMRDMAHLAVSPRGFRPDPDQFDEAFDAVLAAQQIDAAAIEDLPFPDTRALFLAVLAETWGSEEEEKNLSGSGPNDQTPNA